MQNFMKLPFTNLARVRSFSGMYPHVYCQLTSLIEPCTALMTTVRFILPILRMGPHVIPYVSFKRLPTNVALVKTFIFVERQDVTL